MEGARRQQVVPQALQGGRGQHEPGGRVEEVVVARGRIRWVVGWLTLVQSIIFLFCLFNETGIYLRGSQGPQNISKRGRVN